MTVDKQLKQRARQLAASEGISYQDALYRLDPARGALQSHAPGIFNNDRGVGIPLTWEDLNRYMDRDDEWIQDSRDPYTRAAGFKHRALLWGQLAVQTKDPTYAAACTLAGLTDQVSAARIRFEHGIPTILPKTEAELLGLRTCDWCGRPWQADATGACPKCPRLLFGPTPGDREEAQEWAGNKTTKPRPATGLSAREMLRRYLANEIAGMGGCEHRDEGCTDCLAEVVLQALARAQQDDPHGTAHIRDDERSDA